MLEKYYEKVKGIVHRCRKDYYLHLWEKEDWDQEGLICLYELLEAHPELVKEEKKLYVYFKTKFRNRILDSVRKQERLAIAYQKEDCGWMITTPFMNC